MLLSRLSTNQKVFPSEETTNPKARQGSFRSQKKVLA